MNGRNDWAIRHYLMAQGNYPELNADPLTMWVDSPKTLQSSIDIRSSIIQFLSQRVEFLRDELRNLQTAYKKEPSNQIAARIDIVRQMWKDRYSELSKYACLQTYAKLHLKRIYLHRRIERSHSS